MSLITCPNCGEKENLDGVIKGEPGQETITVTCGSCDLSWVRDRTPTCPTCAATDLRQAARSIVEKSRGTQLSIQAMEVIFLCPACDAADLHTWNQSNTPLRPREMPVDGD